MSGAIKSILAGLIDAFAPLLDALRDPDELIVLLEDLGWRFDPEIAIDAILDENGDYAQFASVIADIRASIESAQAVATQIRTDESVDLPAVLALADDFKNVFTSLRALKAPGAPQLPQFLDIDDLWDSLSDDLPELLICEHLSSAYPKIYANFVALGIIELRDVDPGAGTGILRSPYRKHQINWGYIGDVLSDPVQHLREVYRWDGLSKPGDQGTGFAIMRLLTALRSLMRAVSFPGSITPVDPQIVQRFYDPLNLAEPTPQMQLVLPVVEGSQSGAYYRLALLAAPLLEAQNGEPEGILLTHLSSGSVTRDLTLADEWVLSMSGSVDADFALELKISPDGVNFAHQMPQPPSLSVGLRGAAAANPGAWPLLGPLDGTGISLRSIQTSVGFGPAGNRAEVTAEMALEGLAINLGPGEGDGLLNSLLGNLNLSAELDLALQYGTQSGFTVAGSGGLTALVSIDKTIGPLYFDTVEVSLGPENTGGFALTGLVSGSATIGPIYAAVERVGVRIGLEPAENDDGMIGPFDLGVGFVPPSGYAASLDLDPITGGGYISVAENEYRGALALQFEKFGFSAFAILNTELPGGQPGFSLAASVFGEFNLPLAYGFFLTGLGGVLGINRTVDTDALRDVLYEGRMDDLLFPSDPIASAQDILNDMAAILPVAEGQHFIGPVARISWGKPTLINIKLGVIIEVGQEVRLVILGGLSMILPDEDKILVSINLNFFGEIDFAAGTISFDASLVNSRVLTFAISGDTAIRTGWAPRIEHVASFGGLHPQYPKPDNLPDLRRLSIAFGGNNPRLTFSAYQAITANSLQFGARADLYAKGPKVKFVGQVAAEGYVAFDALIYFNPFEFFVSLEGGLSILVNGKVKAGLFFALSLRGPNTFKIDGEVWVKVLGVKVRFAITHSWGQKQSIPNATASAVSTLRQALERSGFEPVAPSGQSGGVSFVQDPDLQSLIDPLGGLRLTQAAVPLGVRIEKLGEADITGSDLVDIEVTIGGAPATASDATGEFVRGHFFSITKSERLRAPAFETHKAGIEFEPDALVSSGSEVAATYDYEVIPIDVHQPPTSLKGKLSDNMMGRARGKYHDARFRDAKNNLSRVETQNRVTLVKESYLSAEIASELRTQAQQRGETLAKVASTSNRTKGALSQFDNAAELPETNTLVASYLSAA